MKTRPRPVLSVFLGLLLPLVGWAETTWSPGARVLVEKAGAAHRAIILKTEPGRYFIAYEGEDEKFDEWVDDSLIRASKAPQPFQLEPTEPAATSEPVTPSGPAKPVERETEEAATGKVEGIGALPLPRPAADALVVPVWLEALPRAQAGEALRFNEAQLARPQFALPNGGGIASPRPPLQAVFLPAHGSVAAGYAALEGGEVVVYRPGEKGFLAPQARLEPSGFGAHALTGLYAGDLNSDGAADLVVVGGPVLQVYFARADGGFSAAAQPYRSKQPLRAAAVGRFFAGANPRGVAVVEGANTFRLLSATAGGVVAVNEPYAVKFDRILDLVAGDFDGDGFSDLAVATETKGRSTGAWMYFNQTNTSQAFLWPVGGRDDFARALHVDDLDRDGRDDLILTDNDADRGERVRVVFGSAGRSGWEDPWELIGQELGLGLGTGGVVTGDFNRDGRRDIGVAGRNGLRVHLGADYRRFGRNPVWPVIAGGGSLPDQRAFLAADFNGDGQVDLLGFTPAFATGYNLLLNATAENVAGTFVPPPLKPKAPAQASSTVTKVERVRETPPGTPELRFLASRAEPYGPYRYRIVVEVAAMDDGVVQAVEATCKYAHEGPLQEVTATGERLNAEQWSLQVVLPRGRNYEFTITARDDQGTASPPLRVAVSP